MTSATPARPRRGGFRTHGSIPERRHDAFLVSLLLAVGLHFLLFIAQAWLPGLIRIISLLEITEPEMEKEEDQARPFVLVSAPFPEDEEPPDNPEAESDSSRLARQNQATPELPEDKSFQPDGVEEILSLLGNPGPAENYVNSQPDNPEEPDNLPEPAASEPEIPAPEPLEENPPPAEAEELEAAETGRESGAEPLTPETPTPESPEENPASAEAGTPEAEESGRESGGAEAAVLEPAAEAETLELAMLPESAAGPALPEASRPGETASRIAEAASRTAREEFSNSPPLAAPPLRLTEMLSDPPIKRIDGAAERVSGGAPPRRNVSSRVDLLSGGDAIMNLLASEYGEYMGKMARQLQDSLTRQMILSPFDYTRGQVRIRFGVSPDGALTYQTTVYPADGSKELERILSERTVREAAPFEPFTPQMRLKPGVADLFQKLTVTVNLY